MSVRWGNTTSKQFTVANDVKQGGVISPILCDVYIDALSAALNSSGIGDTRSKCSSTVKYSL